MLTLQQCAERTGYTVLSLKRKIYSGVLPATKFGRSWAVTEDDLAKLPAKSKRGRPAGGTVKRDEEYEGFRIIYNRSDYGGWWAEVYDLATQRHCASIKRKYKRDAVAAGHEYADEASGAVVRDD